MKYLNYKNQIDRSTSKILMLLCVCFLLVNLSCSDEDCEYTSEVVEVDTFPFACNEGMDVAFLVDYSRSMSFVVENIQNSLTPITDAVIDQSGGDYRLSLSFYDTYDSQFEPTYANQADYTSLPADQKIMTSTNPSSNHYFTMMEKFAPSNAASFSTQFNKLFVTLDSGFGNFATNMEPGGLLLNEILNNNFAGSYRTENLTKLAILITDSQAGGEDDIYDVADDAYLADLANTANNLGVQLILVTTLDDSNLEISLIDNNTGGLKSMSIAQDLFSENIVRLIENVCVNNEG
ncbi:MULTISPECIES: hypothetical protein [unclassified Lacinutrix]